MRLLLDTHIFLWIVSDHFNLKPRMRNLLESAIGVYVSSASIWELSIKAKIGKLDADPEELIQAVDASGFLELPVSSRHAAHVARLQMYHRDPFDRLLLAQAIVEQMQLITVDGQLKQYSPLVIEI